MKTMKRILAAILVCLSIFSAAGLNACADELYWTLKEGTLTISGRGEMPDYSAEVAPWRAADKKAKKVREIRVEDGVTHIGTQSFQFCESAKTAYIAASVKSIGEAAFFNCVKLRQVNLPAGLYEIDVSVFDHCSALENVIIPDGVETIRNAAFNCCESLEWVYIPASVEEIEDSAFNHCIGLKTVYFGGSWSDWDRIEIADYNNCLKNAEIFFKCTVN